MENIIKKIKSIFAGKFFISINKKEKDEKLKKVKPKKNLWGFISVVLLSLVSIGTGTTLGLIEANKKKDNIDVEKIVINNSNKIKRRLFLLSNDNLTIPVTISLEKKSSLHEELKDIFDLLKESTPFSNDYLKGFINNEVKVNKMILENGVLSLDVNEKIIETDKDLNKTFEALNQSFLQYDEIEKVNVTINDKSLNEYEESKNINSILEAKSINDNNYYLSKRLGQKEVVFYERVYKEDAKYLVPVTVYINEKTNFNQSFVNATKVSQPISSKLKNLKIYDSLEELQTKDDLIFLINKNALNNDGLVNKELYDLVSLSFDFMNVTKPVSFIMNTEEISVSGIAKDVEVPVSSIIYNEMKI